MQVAIYSFVLSPVCSSPTLSSSNAYATAITSAYSSTKYYIHCFTLYAAMLYIFAVMDFQFITSGISETSFFLGVLQVSLTRIVAIVT